MMKKINYIIFTIILFVCGMTSISAATTDFSKVKLTVEGLKDNDQSNAYIRITDATFAEDSSFKVIISKDNTDIPESFNASSDEYDRSALLCSLKLENGTVIDNATVCSSDYLKATEKYGDVYVTFYEDIKDGPVEYKKVSDTILVSRPASLPLSKRITAYLFPDRTSFFLRSLNYISTERKVNYKIGVISDKSILNKIKNGNYVGLQELLTYAKNDNNSAMSGNTKADYSQPALLNQNKLVEGSYYYVYLELDDENGTYYPVEDVNLYLCMKADNGLWLADYTDSSFTWNLEETEWDKFVDKFKENDTIKYYEEDSSSKITINHDDKKMTITLTVNGETYTTQLNYNNGIVSYESAKNKKDEELFVDSLWTSVALQVWANKFNYDFEKLALILQSRNDFTLAKDGIEFTSGKFNIEEVGSNFETTITGAYYSTLKFDLINGLSSYNEKIPDTEDKDIPTDTPEVENPETGNASRVIGITTVTILFIGLVAYIKVKKYSKFPQA